MPVAVGAAIASSFIAEAIVAPLVLNAVIGSFGAALITGAVGFATSAIVNAAFSDTPDSPQSASFEQELRDNLVTLRQPITHWQWIYGRTRAGGALTFAHESADGNTHLIITLAGHVCEEISEVWFDDAVVPLDGSGNATGTFAGYARVLKSLGAEAGQPFAALVAESEGKWTDAHRQTGRTKIYVRLTPNADVFPTGIPNITCVIKGKKVYDPRSTLTAYSANPSLCIADFLCSSVWLGATYATEIDETQLIAAANVDDENVALAGGGTEDRYTLNGSFEVNNDSRSVLGRLLSANAGRLYYIGGVFRIHPAAYASPTITLDEDDLRGVPQVEPRLSATDLCNAVKGVYVAEDNNWQPSDFPAVTNATYLAEDNAERSWRELDLPFTKSAATAQRIAKIELERTRQQIGLVWPGKFTCYRLQPGDTVQITFAMLGWSAKVFEVMAAALAIEDDGAGGVRLGCDLTLRETASAVFDWSSGEETEVDPAPDTNLPDPFTVATPGVPSVTEELYETRDGRGVAAKAIVSWSTIDAFAAESQLEYKLASNSAYTVLPITRGTTVEILDMTPGRYDFRVKSINQIGVASAYATRSNWEIVGLSARPAAPTGLAIQAIGGQALLTFTQAPELDVRRGGRILVRHCEDTASPTWEASFSIGNADGYAGDAVYLLVPLKAGTYLLKTEDSSGQQSSSATTITTRQASVLTFSSVGSVTEDSTFPGTHSNTVRDGSMLKLTGAGLFDAIADLDAMTSTLDSYGGVVSSGTYTFSAGIDLGSVQNVRLTGLIVGLVVNVNDIFDDRTGNIDDWLDFDGTAGGGSGDAYLEARQTDDDPAGAPAWSSWVRLDAAEKNARAFQFRLQLSVNDAAYNEHITQLRVAAAQVV